MPASLDMILTIKESHVAREDYEGAAVMTELERLRRSEHATSCKALDHVVAELLETGHHMGDLWAVLTALLEHYVAGVNSGDCGNWDPEEEQQVKNARRALADAYHLIKGTCYERPIDSAPPSTGSAQ